MVLATLYFGFDLVNVIRVMTYVENNFVGGEDYNMYIGMGDDCMNTLEVLSEDLDRDVMFGDLVKECDGEGNFED